MITDANLLQANATIITGLLIFVTISPLSRLFEEVKRTAIIVSTFGAILFLICSIVLLLFFPSNIFSAKVFFVIGLCGVPATLVILLFIDKILVALHIRRSQKG
jgi:hypothetical protein